MTQRGGLNEPEDRLSPEMVDQHRVIVSIEEEFQAIDAYDQRIEATSDADLASLLAHNRDEEKEHAAMLLEWLRRHDPVLDSALRTYLFTSAPITEIEAGADGNVAEGSGIPEVVGSFGLGSLKGESL
jgi:ferritin-like protein